MVATTDPKIIYNSLVRAYGQTDPRGHTAFAGAVFSRESLMPFIPFALSQINNAKAGKALDDRWIPIFYDMVYDTAARGPTAQNIMDMPDLHRVLKDRFGLVQDMYYHSRVAEGIDFNRITAFPDAERPTKSYDTVALWSANDTIPTPHATPYVPMYLRSPVVPVEATITYLPAPI
jgi:hypothetical protein